VAALPRRNRITGKKRSFQTALRPNSGVISGTSSASFLNSGYGRVEGLLSAESQMNVNTGTVREFQLYIVW
jgi:hypothetical protein